MNKLSNHHNPLPTFALFLALCFLHPPLHAFDEVLRIENSDITVDFGKAILGTIDVDGDGRNDVFVSAPDDNQGGTFAGKVQVYSGTGATLIWEVIGKTESGRFGHAFARAGDYNDDGVQDLLVSETGYERRRGRVLVLSGDSGEQLAEFEDPDGEANHVFGHNLAFLGDVNDDDKPDYLVSIPGYVNEDGSKGAVALISGDDGSLIDRFEGNENAPQLGKSLIALGDVDGDLIPDFVAGSTSVNRTGRVHVYSGKIGTLLYAFKDDTESDFGYALATVGDLDGDQINDFAVGAPYESNDRGQVTIHSGANGTPILQVTGGVGKNNLGTGVSAVGDVNSDGVNDFAAVSMIHGSRANYITIFSGVDGTVLKRINNEETAYQPSIVYAGKDQWQGEAALLIGVRSSVSGVASNVSLHRGIGKEGDSFMIRHPDGSLSMGQGKINDIKDDDEDKQP